MKKRHRSIAVSNDVQKITLGVSAVLMGPRKFTEKRLYSGPVKKCMRIK